MLPLSAHTPKEHTPIQCEPVALDLRLANFSESIHGHLRLRECTTTEAIGQFVAARNAMPQHLLGFLSDYSVQDYESQSARLFLAHNHKGGFGLIGDHLCSVFSHPGMKYGTLLVSAAIDYGARRLTCYDAHGVLGSLYSGHGFREIERHKWLDHLAPPHWNYARWGRPDFLIMER